MIRLDNMEALFVVSAFVFQLVLIIHFSMRRWAFDTAIRLGPIVYALSIPAAVVSILILTSEKTWSFWMGGFLYLVWAIFGYFVEYIKKLNWRSPIRWEIFGPYVLLYVATCMFYWFPLALIQKPLWYMYGILFIISTILNVSSHQTKTSTT